VSDKLAAWYNLVAKVSHIQLIIEKDVFTWNLHKHGQFSLRSIYQFVMNHDSLFSNNFIWKMKIQVFPLVISARSSFNKRQPS
jgi:hypothetical protein